MKVNSEIYEKLAGNRHLLIGGRAGSGKSVTLNAIISLFAGKQKDACFFLVDPKQVEWANLAKELTRDGVKTYYVTDPSEACIALWEIGHSDHGDVFVFIDELAEVLCGDEKGAETLQKALVRENVRVFAATQTPSAIPEDLIAAFPAVLALPCCEEEESVHLVGTPDAAGLPFGNGVMKIANQTMAVSLF